MIVLFLTVCFKEVTRCPKEVLMVFQDNLLGVSRVLQGLFMIVSRVFFASSKGVQEGTKDVSRVFPKC